MAHLPETSGPKGYAAIGSSSSSTREGTSTCNKHISSCHQKRHQNPEMAASMIPSNCDPHSRRRSSSTHKSGRQSPVGSKAGFANQSASRSQQNPPHSASVGGSNQQNRLLKAACFGCSPQKNSSGNYSSQADKETRPADELRSVNSINVTPRFNLK